MLLVSAARLRPRADHAPRTCEAQPRQRPMRPSAAAIVNGWFGVARMSLKGRTQPLRIKTTASMSMTLERRAVPCMPLLGVTSP